VLQKTSRQKAYSHNVSLFNPLQRYHTGAATTADCGDYDIILLGLLAGGVRHTINLVSFGITLRQRQAKEKKNTLVNFSDTGFAML
jgi:hypothetical protein